MLSNSFVITFYWRTRKKLVSAIYIILTLVNLIICSTMICHVVSFIMYKTYASAFNPDLPPRASQGEEEMKEVKPSRDEFKFDATIPHALRGKRGAPRDPLPTGYSSDIFMVVHIIVFNCFQRFSGFINCLLCVTRTISIVSPFYRINRRMISVCSVVYLILQLLIIVYCLVGLDGKSRMMCMVVNQCRFIGNEAVFQVFYLWPFVIPSLVLATSCFITIYKMKRAGVRNSERERKVTVTILIVTIIFLVCNLSNLTYVMMAVYLGYDKVWIKVGAFFLISYISEYVFTFVGVTITPIILVLRGSNFRQRGMDVKSSLATLGRFSENRTLSCFARKFVAKAKGRVTPTLPIVEEGSVEEEEQFGCIEPSVLCHLETELSPADNDQAGQVNIINVTSL